MSPTRRIILAYSAAILSVFIAVAVRIFLEPVVGNHVPFLLFSLAPTIAAWVGGLLPGVFATFLSSLCAIYFFIPPQYSFAIPDSATVVKVCVYAVQGVAISWMLEALHRMRQRTEKGFHELKIATESLRLSEVFKSKIIEHSSDCIKVLDKDGRLLFMSPGGLKILGIKDFTAYEQHPWLDFWSGTDRIHAEQALESARAGGTGRMEGFCPTATGVPKWWEVIITALEPLAGSYEPSRFLAVSRDITERRRAQEKISQSEKRYRSLVASTSAIVFTSDQFGCFIEPQVSWEAFTGQPWELHHGFGWIEMYHKDDQDAVRETFQKASADERLELIEARLWNKERGEFRHISVCAIAVETSDGAREWFGTIKDIHDIKVANETIRDSERDYRAIFELVGSGKGQIDPTTRRFVRVNQKLCEMTGYSEDELLDMTFTDITHPEDRVHDAQIYANTIAGTRDSWASEKRYVRKDGDIIWVSVAGTVIRNQAGTPLLTVSTIQDISVRKKTEERLHFLLSASTALASSLDYETTLNKVASLSVPTYADYCVVEVSDASGHLQQIAVAHRDEKKVALLRRLREKYPPKVYKNHASTNLVQTGAPQLFPLITKESLKWVAVDEEHLEMMNTLSPCSYLLMPIKSYDKIVGTIGFMYAESGRRYDESDLEFAEEIARRAAMAIENAQLYRRLEQSKDEAESASRMKASFLANMSHEIRTPLNAILGFSEMLGDRELSDMDREEYSEIVQRNGELLTRLIDDILDLSKVEAGRLGIIKSRVVISELMAEVTTVLNEQARKKGIRLSIESDRQVPDIIESDPMRLRQILFNVIGNAIKFTEQGSVTVFIKYTNSAEATSGTLEFKVVDTGRGLTSPEAKRLFQPFTQADESVTRQFGGTGLGLVLSRRLSRALGGDLTLETSQLGKGSTFVIVVEVFRFESRDMSQTMNVICSEPRLLKSTKSEGYKDLEGLRVLVVDDSPDNRLLMERLLDQRKALVTMAGNGLEGVKLGMAENFDLILMDIQMPEMDGYEAAATLRNKGYAGPIIALTAHVLDDEIQRCKNAGFNGHISKPVNQEKLLEAVREIIPIEAISEVTTSNDARKL